MWFEVIENGADRQIMYTTYYLSAIVCCTIFE